MYTYQCGRCGAFLDPGERCTCAGGPPKEKTAPSIRYKEETGGQYRMFCEGGIRQIRAPQRI